MTSYITTKKSSTQTVLAHGSRGPEVKRLQQLLDTYLKPSPKQALALNLNKRVILATVHKSGIDDHAQALCAQLGATEVLHPANDAHHQDHVHIGFDAK
jgi:hypothetical protein